MSSIGYELIKELTLLSSGRQPAIEPAGDWLFSAGNGAPQLLSDGVGLDGELVALVGCRASESSNKAKLCFRIDGYDAATTYSATVTRGATQVTETSLAAGSAALALDELKTAFEISLAAYNPTCTVLSSPHDILVIELDAPFSQTADDTGGTGKIYCAGDARCFAYRVWGLPLWAGSQSNGPVWQPIDDGLVRIGVWPIHVDHVSCAGMSRLYVEQLGSDGFYIPFVGPSGAESSATQYSTTLNAAESAWSLKTSQRLELVDEVTTEALVNTTQSFSGSGALGVDLPLPFPAMSYPVNLPQFDLLVKNTGATVVMVSNEEPSAANPDPISQVPIAQTLILGPYDKLLHPVTLYDSAAGAVAGAIKFQFRGDI